MIFPHTYIYMYIYIAGQHSCLISPRYSRLACTRPRWRRYRRKAQWTSNPHSLKLACFVICLYIYVCVCLYIHIYICTMFDTVIRNPTIRVRAILRWTVWTKMVQRKYIIHYNIDIIYSLKNKAWPLIDNLLLRK